MLGDVHCYAPRQQHYRQVTKGLDALDDALCLCLILHDRVIHRTVWLYVGDLSAIGASQSIKCTDLISHLIGEFVRVVINKAATEACGVVITHVRAYGHAGLCGCLQCASNRVWVTRMEPGGHVC